MMNMLNNLTIKQLGVMLTIMVVTFIVNEVVDVWMENKKTLESIEPDEEF